jgi:hypothetical protein
MFGVRAHAHSISLIGGLLAIAGLVIAGLLV